MLMRFQLQIHANPNTHPHASTSFPRVATRQENAGLVGLLSLNLTQAPAAAATPAGPLSPLGQAITDALEAVAPRVVPLSLDIKEVGLAGREGWRNTCCPALAFFIRVERRRFCKTTAVSTPAPMPPRLQLSARPWWPMRHQTTERLLPGRLQLAKGTQVRGIGVWVLLGSRRFCSDHVWLGIQGLHAAHMDMSPGISKPAPALPHPRFWLMSR